MSVSESRDWGMRAALPRINWGDALQLQPIRFGDGGHEKRLTSLLTRDTRLEQMLKQPEREGLRDLVLG